MRSTICLICIIFSSFSYSNSVTIIGHRGAPGYLPEHTLESLVLAYSQGADYIEQDLVASKDGQLVVLHDNHLETVTDVEQKFPHRMRSDTRYYALDFTRDELKSLRVHERQDAEGNPVFSNRYQGNAEFKIATFEEHIELINQLNRQFGRSVGIYPEIKSPKWHKEQGIDISKLTVDVLNKHQLNDPDKPVYVQCFDFEELKRIRNQLAAKVKLVQLIAENSWQESDSDYTYLRTPQGLAEIAKVAQGIGPWLPHVIDINSGKTQPLMKVAHDLGLVVHPYTFRVDQLPVGLSSEQTLDLLIKQAHVDGIFTDFTDVVVEYLQRKPMAGK